MKKQIQGLFILTLLLVSIFHALAINAQDKPYVVVLSLDGFRWDYTEKTHTPNFDFIAKNGVKAESLKPSFPTKTFPNHYSIATGLYPDHHGIVANSFYDPDSNRTYRISDRSAVEDGYFYKGEPIWNTAEKQDLTSASFFWVGSEANIQDIQPTYWKKYEQGFPFFQRLDTVVSWLQLPKKLRPHLVLWYLHEPDGIGHTMGPDSDMTKNNISYLDSLLGTFIAKIAELPIYDQINFVVLSDHGMTKLSSDKIIYLSDYIEEEWFERIEGGTPVYCFEPKTEYKNVALDALQAIGHVKVWEKKSLPYKWHYGTNPRIQELVMVAENGWQVKINRNANLYNGDHGYDNDFKDMHGIFYAMGPAFKVNHIHPTFENIHIYNLLCNILNLNPAPNDGNPEKIINMLKKQ